ncbi:hypothetical protein A8C56_14120 [Niabella ginsenosidivorans]|uniref:Uncharacterized protein n=1 Tax=Niabella ginsenosidivorans TaxID=1176587 RepID=A0A1A9I5K1_9BACT|nr:hypothetical protein [Niabella ginsenosidivorans]ANH81951.1 hypothetical protein A8C56_14120 [Niabella ginsenosidivorans]
MIDDLNLKELRKARRIGYYFRYPLHRNNFHVLEAGDHIYGHYTAKPLYGQLTPEGRVDKSSGFNGDVAVLFVPLAAKKPDFPYNARQHPVTNGKTELGKDQ